MKRLALVCLAAMAALILTSGCSGQWADNKFEGGEEGLVKELVAATGAKVEYTLLTAPPPPNGAVHESLSFEGTLPPDGRSVAEVAWDAYRRMQSIDGIQFSAFNAHDYPSQHGPVAACWAAAGSKLEVHFPDQVPEGWTSCGVYFQAARGGDLVTFQVSLDQQPDGTILVAGGSTPVRE